MDTFLTFKISHDVYGYQCIFCHWIAHECRRLLLCNNTVLRKYDISFILRATINREANDGLDVDGCVHGGGGSDDGCGGRSGGSGGGGSGLSQYHWL